MALVFKIYFQIFNMESKSTSKKGGGQPMKKIISIDHGNRLIKGETNILPSAFIESDFLPTIGGDVLKYNGRAYTLVDESLPVQNDKSEDERYFVLSLFALGKELAQDAEMVRKLTPHDPINVELLIGLPLQHYETYKKKFERYFTDRIGAIRYEFNGKPFLIRFTGAHAFPQAYAAAITAYDRLKDSRVVNIVDIGGFTVDCLQLNKFKPNMALCTSLYWGVNTLCQSINDRVRGAGGRDISDDVIERILRKESDALSEYSENRINIVTTAAKSHVSRMLAEIAQKGFDLDEDKTVFMGGGSILLKDYIIEANKAKKPIFIDDIHANAKGFRLIYDMQNGNTVKKASGA
jgi:plasmid segregation protein ParM